ISNDVEAEGVAVKERRLPGVADEELQMVDAAEGKIVVHVASGPYKVPVQSTGIPNRRTSDSNSRRRNGNDGALNRWSCMRDGSCADSGCEPWRMNYVTGKPRSAMYW